MFYFAVYTIRQYATVRDNKIVIHLPDEWIGKEVEILIVKNDKGKKNLHQNQMTPRTLS